MASTLRHLGLSLPPLCSCGCGNPVSRRENGSSWNRYAFPRCRQRVSDRKRFTSQPSPECACGCGLPARLNKRSGKPTLYAADKCRVRAFELNKRFGLVGDRPKICACGCGAPLIQDAKKPRKFATVQCRKRAWREVHRPNRVLRPAKSSGDVVAAPHFDIGNLAKWAKKSLVVPPGHPMAGKPMALPPFGRWFLRDVLKPETREALLCLGRKNAKSALVALLCLSYLCGPLAGEGGWRAGVASVNKSKARELVGQIEQIAEASGLADKLKFRRSPWPGSISSPAGTVEILAGDSGMGGHSASLDLAIVDELGLMSERDRELVASMRAATSAKDGKFIALSIWGSGPFIPEIVKRRDHEGVKVHLFQPAKDCDLLDRTAWEAANPGLGFIKSSTYMEHEAKRAKSTPSDEAFFRAQDLNLPGSPTVERIVSPADWSRCNGPVPERDGRCVVGVDLGGSLSMTAAVALWPGSGRVEVWGAFPSVPPLEDRQRRDGLRYDLMLKSGELELHDGRLVRVGTFLQAVVSRLQGEKVLMAGADRYRRAETEQALSDAGVRWNMAWRGTGASKTADGSFDVRAFQRMVLEKRLFHGNSLMLASAVAGSKLRYDGAGNPALDKQGGLNRIDSLSAAVIACGLAETMRTKKPNGAWRSGGVVRAA